MYAKCKNVLIIDDDDDDDDRPNGLSRRLCTRSWECDDDHTTITLVHSSLKRIAIALSSVSLCFVFQQKEEIERTLEKNREVVSALSESKSKKDSLKVYININNINNYITYILLNQYYYHRSDSTDFSWILARKRWYDQRCPPWGDQSAVVSNLRHASCAWCTGFAKASDKQRLEAFIKRSKRTDFCLMP